jgi:hypothetical protein
MGLVVAEKNFFSFGRQQACNNSLLYLKHTEETFLKILINNMLVLCLSRWPHTVVTMQRLRTDPAVLQRESCPGSSGLWSGPVVARAAPAREARVPRSRTDGRTKRNGWARSFTGPPFSDYRCAGPGGGGGGERTWGRPARQPS